MENTQLIGLSRQVALRRELDVIANNLANMETAGFKRHNVMFEEYLMPVAEYGDVRRDRPLSYVHDRATIRDFQPGAFEQTGNNLDVAIRGDAWFAIETENGERYTRNGAFTIDANGFLTQHTGELVLGEDGPIAVPEDAPDIAIARDGTISADGEILGTLRVVSFDNQRDLKAIGNNFFESEAPPQPAEGVVIQQGMLEGANVEGVLEMARMIEVTRAYSSITRSLDRVDQLRRDAIERLGTAPS
ncbi:MAG: flagellar basal-body rod protein FlgF [Pseudomonadota bacterium]